MGSAIPASELGGVVVKTFTTVLPGSTILGTTIEGGVSTVTVDGSVRTTSLVGSTRVGTTVLGRETVITTTERAGASSTLSSETLSASPTGSHGEKVGVGLGALVGCAGLLMMVVGL